MIARFIVTSCLLASVCFISACKSATTRSGTALGTNRFDIALEGPWILYQETQFDDHGKKTAVLVAIAPDLATAEPFDKDDDRYHHAPQLSTGDGYPLTNPAIYCLTLDGTCAPAGAGSLNSDGYPQALPLNVPFRDATDTSTAWNWVSYRGSNTTLILPMPDSYSNDGLWRMRFASDFDPTGTKYSKEGLHSIGLLLHYTNGPKLFSLRSCDEKQPSVATCITPPKRPRSPDLTNTGTLRIEMRAPDNNNPCDRHVRFAYHEAFKLVSNAYDKDIAYIEPAQAIYADGTAKYGSAQDHACFDDDPQKQTTNAVGSTQDTRLTTSTMPMSATLSTLLSTVIKDIDLIKEKHDNNPDLQYADSSATSAKDLTEALDPEFPRISQLLLIGKLLSASENAIDSFETDKHNKITKEDRERLAELEERFKRLKPFAPKNGNDCRAAVMLMGP